MTRSWIYSPSGSIKDILVQIYLVLRCIKNDAQKWNLQFQHQKNSGNFWEALCSVRMYNWIEDPDSFVPAGERLRPTNQRVMERKCLNVLSAIYFSFPRWIRQTSLITAARKVFELWLLLPVIVSNWNSQALPAAAIARLCRKLKLLSILFDRLVV